MAKKDLNLQEVSDLVKQLSFEDFSKIVQDYSQSQNTDSKKILNDIVKTDLDTRLSQLNINSSCPYCSSDNIQKYGYRNNIQRFKCLKCSKCFTHFTGTILEKTHWHWNIWIKVLEMTLNNYSILDMKNVLEKDFNCLGINTKTIWLWRLKLIHALAEIPMPKLSGIVQIDETFIRESQKGSRHLESIVLSEDRLPRYGRIPSKYGVMGSEFATVVTAIDNKGFCVCKVTGLGKLTPELFYDLFHEHLDNPAYICSDANSVYEDYCQLTHTPHYIHPSNYLKTLVDNGYTLQANTENNKSNNKKILKHLYYEEMIDYISNRGDLLFENFCDLKYENELSLGKVNELHSEIKLLINKEMTNVSTKYLQDYIGYFTYLHNWKVSHNHYPSSKADAESIFIDILKGHHNYTLTQIEHLTLNLPKPSTRYLEVLKEETDKARNSTDNKYFKFNEEDGVLSFNKREYLLDLPKGRLYEVAKECHIKHYKKLARWSLVSAILKQDNIQDILYQLLAKDRDHLIDEEDLEAMKSKGYLL